MARSESTGGPFNHRYTLTPKLHSSFDYSLQSAAILATVAMQRLAIIDFSAIGILFDYFYRVNTSSLNRI